MKKKKNLHLRNEMIAFIIAITALCRLLPHPPNFSPVAAIALFGGIYYSKRYMAYLVPLVSLWLSDILLNYSYYHQFVLFYDGFYFTYGTFALIVLLSGLLIRKVKVQSMLVASLSASVLFFIVSNFGVWFSTAMYPHTQAGLMACYVAGLPFFSHTLIGDLVYTGLLFGLFEFLQSRVPALQSRRTIS